MKWCLSKSPLVVFTVFAEKALSYQEWFSFLFCETEPAAPSPLSSLFTVPLLSPSRRLFFCVISRLISCLMNPLFPFVWRVQHMLLMQFTSFSSLLSSHTFAFLRNTQLAQFSLHRPNVQGELKIMDCVMRNALKTSSKINVVVRV